jgi:hypothetical protein
MFCDGCGSELAAGQDFCSRCGKKIVGQVQLAYPRAGRVREHVRLLGILWIAYSAFHVIGGIVLIVLANTLFLHLHDFGGPPHVGEFLHPLLSVIGVFLLIKATAGFAAGWGLLQREPWARVLTIVLAFISMFTNIPIGTALGIYSLWVLLPAPSEAEYEGMARAA